MIFSIQYWCTSLSNFHFDGSKVGIRFIKCQFMWLPNIKLLCINSFLLMVDNTLVMNDYFPSNFHLTMCKSFLKFSLMSLTFKWLLVFNIFNSKTCLLSVFYTRKAEYNGFVFIIHSENFWSHFFKRPYLQYLNSLYNINILAPPSNVFFLNYCLFREW